jgi:hypothetical protein
MNGIFSNKERYKKGEQVKLCPTEGFTADDFGVDEEVFVYYVAFQGQTGTIITEKEDDQYPSVVFPNGTVLRIWEVHLEKVEAEPPKLEPTNFMSEPIKVLDAEVTLHMALHILRNPYGWSEDSVRKVRLWAADRLETLNCK